MRDKLLQIPVGNVMLKMFLAIPPEELAGIPQDKLGVWSSAPTQVELSCPIDTNSIFQEFATDQAIWSDASDKYLHSEPFSYVKASNPTISKPTTLLRLEVIPNNDAVAKLTLTGFDANGKEAFEVIHWRDQAETLPSVAGRALPPDPNPVIVSVPTETERLIRLWSSAPLESEMATWVGDQALRNIYFNPEKYDPVGETFGRVMVEVAKAHREQMVAAEPADFALHFPAQAIVKGRLTERVLAEAFFEAGATFRRVLYANDNSWITARPGLIGVGVEREFDRPTLGKLLRTARDSQTVTLMDAARYAAGSGNRMAIPCLRLLPLLTQNVAGLELLTEDTWDLMAFLGRLDDDQIAQAQQPTGLALAVCTPFQLESLARDFQMTRFAWRGQTDCWRSHPTDGLPTGLPGGGVLHLTVDAGTAIRMRHKFEGGYSQDTYRSVSDTAQTLAVPNNSFNLTGLIPQMSQSYVFNFVFPYDVIRIENVNDYRPAGKEVRSVDELDEPLRSQLKAAIDRASKK